MLKTGAAETMPGILGMMCHPAGELSVELGGWEGKTGLGRYRPGGTQSGTVLVVGTLPALTHNLSPCETGGLIGGGGSFAPVVLEILT